MVQLPFRNCSVVGRDAKQEKANRDRFAMRIGPGLVVWCVMRWWGTPINTDRPVCQSTGALSGSLGACASGTASIVGRGNAIILAAIANSSMSDGCTPSASLRRRATCGRGPDLPNSICETVTRATPARSAKACCDRRRCCRASLSVSIALFSLFPPKAFADLRGTRGVGEPSLRWARPTMNVGEGGAAAQVDVRLILNKR